MADQSAAETINQLKLAETLSQASKEAHKQSNSLVNARLVVLFTDKHLYGRAIGCFYHIFKALEAALTKNQHVPEIQAMWEHMSRLFATQAWEEDLLFYLGAQWQELIPPGPSTQLYVKHLEDLGNTNPVMLLAHSYTQHLGRAVGGQIIRRMARKQLRLPEDKGTAIFDLPESGPSAHDLRTAFKDALNTVAKDWPQELTDKMVEEHLTAFRYNSKIITEFKVGWWPFLRGLFVLPLRLF